jgi:regulator of CtrA degradation
MQAPVYFNRTYDETLDLMVEARNYLTHSEKRERRRLGGLDCLRMSCEAMRVTSRLTQVMAWLLTQRAVHEGEITAEQALSDESRLSGGDVCLDETFREDQALPNGLRSLMDRSFRLYVRVARLEAMMLRRVLH